MRRATQDRLDRLEGTLRRRRVTATRGAQVDESWEHLVEVLVILEESGCSPALAVHQVAEERAMTPAEVLSTVEVGPYAEFEPWEVRMLRLALELHLFGLDPLTSVCEWSAQMTTPADSE